MKSPTPESRRLFAAIAPTNGTDFSDFTNDLYDATKALHAVMARVQNHVTMVEGLFRDADAVEESPAVFAKFEYVKQKLAAMRRLTADAQHALDRLRDSSVALDAHGLKCRRAMDARSEEL